MKTTITIFIALFLLQSVMIDDMYARQNANTVQGIVLGPIMTYSPRTGHAAIGFSSDLVIFCFNFSVENRSLFYLQNGEDDLSLVYAGIGYFQFLQIQGEAYSVRLRSDITLFNDYSPYFSDLYDRWAIIRKGVVLTFIADKSWHPSRPSWYLSFGVGICF
jgi:hypothetical protein